MFGSQDSNLNANLFITDGIAAMGALGLIISGILFGILLVFIDLLTNKHDFKLMLITFSSVAITLCNISLFTTLLSGGLISLLLFLFIIKPIEINP